MHSLKWGGGVLRTSHVGEPVVTSYTACYRHAEIRPQMAVSAARCKDEGGSACTHCPRLATFASPGSEKRLRP